MLKKISGGTAKPKTKSQSLGEFTQHLERKNK